MDQNEVEFEPAPNTVAHQGDIGLRRVQSLPDGLEKLGGDLIAYGEATGHAHRVTGDYLLFTKKRPTGEMAVPTHLVARSPVKLVHDEHATVILPIGVYEIKRQKEYDWAEKVIRTVAD